MINGAKFDGCEITGWDAFPSEEPLPGNPLAMAVRLETGCDDDPELPIVAAFVAIDETLDIEALKAVWS